MEMALDEEPVPFVFRKLAEFESIEDHDWHEKCKEIIEIKPVEDDSLNNHSSSSCSANVALRLPVGAACATGTDMDKQALQQESKSVIVMPMPSTASETNAHNAEAVQENYYLVMRKTGENEVKVAVVPAIGNTNGNLDSTNDATHLECKPSIVCNSQVNSLGSVFPNHQEIILKTEVDDKVENHHKNGDVVTVIHESSVRGGLEHHSVVPGLTEARHRTNGRTTMDVGNKDDCEQGPFKPKVRVTVNRSGKRTSLYKCSACGTPFGGICALANLSDTFHVTTCDECDQIFTDEYSIMEHKRQFHGVQLYCENCEKKYAGQASLATPRIDQRQSHEEPATSQLYACEICGKEMKNLFYLNRHRISHNVKYTCTCCGHRFQNRQSFRLHMNLMKVQAGHTAKPLPEDTIPIMVLEQQSSAVKCKETPPHHSKNDAEQSRRSNLKKTCRVCGKVQKNCRPIIPKLRPIILRYYGVDYTEEDENVYPKVTCARCEINLLRPRKSFIRKCAVAEPYLPKELAKFGAEEKPEKSYLEDSLSTASVKLESTVVKHNGTDLLYGEQNAHSAHTNTTLSNSLSHS